MEHDGERYGPGVDNGGAENGVFGVDHGGYPDADNGSGSGGESGANRGVNGGGGGANRGVDNTGSGADRHVSGTRGANRGDDGDGANCDVNSTGKGANTTNRGVNSKGAKNAKMDNEECFNGSQNGTQLTGNGDAGKKDAFGAPTPSRPRQILVRNRPLLNAHLVFDSLSQNTYRLTAYGGKTYEYLPFGGFVSDLGFKFEVFTSQQDEIRNFLGAKTGALASPILKDGSFFVFGLRSYIKISPCNLCKKGKCKNDHLLEKLLEDREKNRMGGAIGPENLNLGRSFEHVRLYENHNISHLILQKRIPLHSMVCLEENFGILVRSISQVAKFPKMMRGVLISK